MIVLKRHASTSISHIIPLVVPYALLDPTLLDICLKAELEASTRSLIICLLEAIELHTSTTAPPQTGEKISLQLGRTSTQTHNIEGHSPSTIAINPSRSWHLPELKRMAPNLHLLPRTPRPLHPSQCQHRYPPPAANPTAETPA